MINFFCNKCNKDLNVCKCKDLEERYKIGFWGSAIEKQAEEAVKEARKGTV